MLAKSSLLAIFCSALACTGTCTYASEGATTSPKKGDDDIAQTLIALEKQSWVAWQGHDGAFFANFLSEDHVEVGARGITDKKSVVAGVASGVCKVDDYAVDQFHATRLSADTAVLAYHARQNTHCGSVAVPSPAWVSSLYDKRNGRWLNAVFQETPTDH
jgi:hypothetical protein